MCIRMRYFVLLLLLCSGISQTVAATVDVVGRLQAVLIDLPALQADFTQQTVTGDGIVLQSSSGTLLVQKPRKFVWDVVEPFRNTTVSDGKQIAIIDYDLEQVVIQEFNEDIYATPAALLSGKKKDVIQAFTIEYSHDNNRETFRLTPKNTESPVETIVVNFIAGTLADLLIADSLGQRSLLTFSNVDTNPNVDESMFAFTFPKNFDVFKQ